MARQKKQDNRTVSFGTNDKDIVKYIDKLTKPFSIYVKELIQQDMNKSSLDSDFKENLKVEMIDILKEALNSVPNVSENKKLEQIKAILGSEAGFRQSFEKMQDSIKDNEPGGNLEDYTRPDFKLVERPDHIELVKAKSNMKEEKIEEEKIEESSPKIHDADKNAALDLFDTENF
jgi:hypothetical protein